MKKLNLIIILILLLAPTFLIFRSFFSTSHLAWGDAPYFYSQGLNELVNEPLAFTNRGINFGGSNLVIFLSPLMILYGLLGSVANLGNDLTIRILFYFPSVLLSLIGAFLVGRYWKKSNTVGFFTALIYTLNTYFILLVDGGQVGVALAYGIFPLAVLFQKKLLDKPNMNNFIISLVALSACVIVDPRVAVLSFITVLVWQIVENVVHRNISGFKNFIWLVGVGVSVSFLSAYWIVPLLKNTDSYAAASGGTSVFKLTNAFLLFSPHWPSNIFGQTTSPLFYFLLLPLLIFIPYVAAVASKYKKATEFSTVVVCYVLFGLSTLVFGYLSRIPFGFAFRDASKLLIPIALFVGLSIGTAVDFVNKKVFSVLVYFYVLLLVWQALLGHMNFVLSNRDQSSDLSKIADILSSDNSFFRTLWIPERHPLTYDVLDKPALDGQSLVNALPFAYNNSGEDHFNFINSKDYLDWFRVFGIKYIVLSNSQRSVSKTTKEINNWYEINSLFSENKTLSKVPTTDVPLYKLEGTFPRTFAVKKVYGVVGKPLNNPFTPSINYEDGLFDPNTMVGIDNKAFSIIFNGGSKTDLQMSFLQKYFKGPQDNLSSQWANYSHADYLKYKYELLIRDVQFEDLDYLKGISFSTQKGEEIKFNFDIKKQGDYVFATRAMDVSAGEKSLTWKFEDMYLPVGEYEKKITNLSGFQVLNVVAVIPKEEFNKAKSTADGLATDFSTSAGEVIRAKQSKEIDYKVVDSENIGTLKYKITNPGESYWIIFTDNYNPHWQLKAGDSYYNSYPIYSAGNAFYISPSWTRLEIQFKGQDNVRWGIYTTIVSGLVLFALFLLVKDKQWKR